MVGLAKWIVATANFKESLIVRASTFNVLTAKGRLAISLLHTLVKLVVMNFNSHNFARFRLVS